MTGTKVPRRNLLRAGLVGVGAGVAWYTFRAVQPAKSPVFIGRAQGYGADLRGTIESGLKELRVEPSEIRGRKILLKPNLVEPHAGVGEVNTHPAVVRAAIESFLALGAERVTVAEGAGHLRDTFLVLEYSGLADVLHEDRIPFADLNLGPVDFIPNRGRQSRLAELATSSVLKEADFVVSLAKMKTHHWAGVTLSMKNMFGVLSGQIYGWPKNLLHWAGLEESILDINASFKADLAIVDGVVGMEGDGPIMGQPVQSGVIVMGRELTAVDATCCRVMEIDPEKVGHLVRADNWLGTIREASIEQRGEDIRKVRKRFALVDWIPAQANIRLS